MKLETLFFVIILFGVFSSCKKSATSKLPSKIASSTETISFTWKHDVYPDISGSMELNSKARGRQSYGGRTPNRQSLTYCYVGEVDLMAKLNEEHVKGNVIAFRFAEYDEATKQEVGVVVKYLVYEGGILTNKVGEIEVTLGPQN